MSSGITHTGNAFHFNVAGVYKIQFSISPILNSSGPTYQVAVFVNGIEVNGSRYNVGVAFTSSTSVITQGTGMVLVNLNAGDSLQLFSVGSGMLALGANPPTPNASILIQKLD